jgi:competence protein ComEC
VASWAPRLAASLVTTLIASVATGAFAAYHFNRLSLLGVVANLLGVPLTGFWIMPWGLLAMLLMPFGLEATGAGARWVGASTD